MKAKSPFVWIFLSLLFFGASADAQILKKLKKKVQQATEDVIIEKAAQKTAQETGKAMDSLLNIDPDYEQKNQEQLQQMFGQGGSDIPIEESYQFDTNVLYTMEFSSGEENSVVDYSMWFSDKDNYMATQVSNIQAETTKNQDMPMSVLSVIDDKNKAMIILMEEQKIAQVVSMEKIKDLSEQETTAEGIDSSFKTVKKTGNSKKILGYDCEEFTSENADTRFTFWVTQDLEVYQKNMFFNISQSLGGNSFGNVPKEAKGLMMEMDFESKSNNERGKMIVKEIRKESKSISTAGYQFMNLSQFMKN
jgi:hypothetical protein